MRKLPENFHPQKKCENLKSRAITKLIRRGTFPIAAPAGNEIMSHIDYALYESPVGYALFKVVHQQEAVGLKLKEVTASRFW